MATFKDLQNANEGLNKLKELDQLGDIVIYNMVMLLKKGNNQFEFFYKYGPDTRDLPAEGAVVGSLIGLLAGPVGMAIGMMTGVMAGAIGEDDTEDFISAISEKVNNRIKTGEYAIVVDVEEDTVLMIDTYLTPYHALILRTDLSDDVDIYDQQQWDEWDEEIDEEEKELAEARTEDKAAIKEKLNKLKQKREERRQKLKERMDNFKKNMQDKTHNLDEKIKTAEGKQKEKLKAYKEKIEAKIEKWNDKIDSALS